jgi:hypothetical protein
VNEQLKASIARIEEVVVDHRALPFGVAEIDDRIPSGGLAMLTYASFA